VNSDLDLNPACDSSCARMDSEDLNQHCYCPALSLTGFHAELEARLLASGLDISLAQSHPHLFAALPVYVAAPMRAQMAAAVAAVETLVKSEHYQKVVLKGASEAIQFDPGSPGGVLGFDFHLGAAGPKLIEINTNPGGLLLCLLQAQALKSCLPQEFQLSIDPHKVEDHAITALREEWRLQTSGQALSTVAIVDDAPAHQYLYPEFLLYRDLLRSHGIDAEIADPAALVRRGNKLCLGDRPVDLIYNRITDFGLANSEHQTLRDAYLEGAVALSPHPRAHALYADKRNLMRMTDPAFLAACGLDENAAATLVDVVPPTVWLSDANRAALWAERRRWFFKPARGYGSKASYRGDKITHKVWEALRDGDYVAQEIVQPGTRASAGAESFKYDLRCYTYGGELLMLVARMYRGQTTNFRTPGGGFAPVVVTRSSEAGRA
jgi:hypothetical protein